MSASTPQSCSPHPSQPAPRRRNWLASAASAVAGVLREMDYAQRRANSIRMSYDAFTPEPRKAPDTYGEFLLRTSGPTPHEPSARRRAAGREVR